MKITKENNGLVEALIISIIFLAVVMIGFALFFYINNSERRFEQLYKQSLERNNQIINWCNAQNKWFEDKELPNLTK